MRNTKRALSARVMGLYLVFSPFFLTAQNGESAAIVVTDKDKDTKRTFSNVDQSPRFPGCETAGIPIEQKAACAQEKLDLYIRENLKYPDAAKTPDFRPVMVRVRMTVDANGKIHSPRILELGNKEFDANALAVCTQMEQSDLKWIPGNIDGINVRSTVMISVHFNWEGRNKAFPTVIDANDDIYELPDEVPAFASCRQPGKKDAQILECAMEYMAGFFNQNMIYPEDAQRVGLEGDIQVEFVVGKDGKVRNVVLKNDIGLGCREEAQRLFDLMNEKNIGWIPGEEDNQKVNVLLKTTVRFRLKEEAKPQTRLASMDPKPLFITGRAGFEDFLKQHLKYPAGKEVNPCLNGVIDVKFKINRQTGALVVTEMIDFNNLGKDFKNAATLFMQETAGQWRINFPGLGDETVYSLSFPFSNDNASCGELNQQYKNQVYASLEDFLRTEKKSTLDQGMDALDKALRLYPGDNKLRHLRGIALYKNNRTIEGCVDLYYVNRQNKDIPVPVSCK